MSAGPPAGTVDPVVLEAACRAILTAVDVPDEDAALVASSLVTAELRGQPTHGVMRLPTYVERIQHGLIDVAVPLIQVSETAATMLFDGNNGLGHVMGARARDSCIERAARTGLALAVVRRSSHFGTAGFFAQRAIDAGVIGFAATNTASLMAPVGALEAVLGTNPLAVAVPVRDGHPILLDMATSTTSLGAILQARENRRPIPDSWALGPDGRPTTDADVAARTRLLQPSGGHKGFGLAFVVEVLTSVLGRAAVGREAGSMYNTWDRPENLGHVFAALDPSVGSPVEDFFDGMDRLMNQVLAAARADPAIHVYLPGEPEFARELERREGGISLPEARRQELLTLADGIGITVEL